MKADLKLIAFHHDLVKRINSVSEKDIGPKGDKGVDGKDGIDGKDGKDGKVGKIGTTGLPGSDGNDGKDGKDGTDGVPGTDGVSVVDVVIDIDGHLTVTLSDGNEIDAGSLEVGKGNTYVSLSSSTMSKDNSPSLGGYLDLNNKGMVATFTASESITAGDICHLDSSGKMEKADASTEATCDTLISLAIDTLSTDNEGTFLLRGFYDAAGYTPGNHIYSSITAGGISETAPSSTGEIVRVLGYAITASQIFFDPDKTWIELA